MVVEESIVNKLQEKFAPHFLEVQNESHMHSVPENSETHFRVILASDSFSGVTRVQRHRMVNEVLAEELAGSVHALSLKLFTSGEWDARTTEPTQSPLCHSKSKS